MPGPSPSTWAIAAPRSPPKPTPGHASSSSTVRLGSYVAPSTLRLGDYLLTWLATRATNGLAPKTVASYRQIINEYISPYLGEVPIQAVTPVTLDDLYGTLLEDGGKRGRGLSNRCVRHTHTVIRAALGDATKKGLARRCLVADCSGSVERNSIPGGASVTTS